MSKEIEALKGELEDVKKRLEALEEKCKTPQHLSISERLAIMSETKKENKAEKYMLLTLQGTAEVMVVSLALLVLKMAITTLI